MDKAAGLDNDSNHPSYKALKKYSGNMQSAPAGSPDSIRMGRGAVKGNTNTLTAGPHRPDTSTMPSLNIPNPDAINCGPQVRTPGGTRPWDPRAGQNYRGNADEINLGRGPTKGNAQ
tara:strand:- start:413 stop:763 length:351 start_codon:yes stop_codon:yes gene_type:complete